jgi:hypothetical protein
LFMIELNVSFKSSRLYFSAICILNNSSGMSQSTVGRSETTDSSTI